MKKIAVSCVALIALFLLSFSKSKPRVLVFYKTGAYYHTSIPAGIAAIQKLASENGFVCDTTRDSLQFNSKNLARYHAVIFLNTTGNVLDDNGQKAFEQFIRSGKGYVGIHAASDTEYDWPWYNQLVGAYFKNHPEQQEATVHIKADAFSSTRNLPAEWKIKEEWYNFRDTHWDKTKVVITLDEKTIKGGANGDYHPLAWYREFDGGRSFYTAIGHRNETFSDPVYLQHLLSGIEYAIGKKK